MPTNADLRELAHLRRARDLMDREFAQPLDVATVARHAWMSSAHFSRRFKAAYGETPYEYLMTRRIERSMALLRAGASVTDACIAVGCTSLGSFSTRFRAVTGETPSRYRSRQHTALVGMPSCLVRVATRPMPARSFERSGGWRRREPRFCRNRWISPGVRETARFVTRRAPRFESPLRRCRTTTSRRRPAARHVD